jgi:hypothetical protein
MTTIDNVLYTGKTRTSGGRDGALTAILMPIGQDV